MIPTRDSFVSALPSAVENAHKPDGVRALDVRFTLTVFPGLVPAPGEYVVSVGKKGFGSAYLITRVKRSPSNPWRFYLTCRRGHTPQDAQAAGFWWEIRWSQRHPGDKREAAACAEAGPNG